VGSPARADPGGNRGNGQGIGRLLTCLAANLDGRGQVAHVEALDSGPLPARRREGAAMNASLPPSSHNEGERRKQDALTNLETRGETIVERGRRVLLRRLLESPTATADDVREAIELPGGLDARCLGAVPIGLARAGIIRSAGYVRSTRPEHHAGPIQLWALADRAAALAWLRSHPEAPAPGPGEQLPLFDADQAAAGSLRCDGRACP
jgi:hypothetical protein